MGGLSPGQRVAGFEVVRLLGAGGMGAVYEARDPAGRAVALKLLLGEADPEQLGRFTREARAAAAVAHPNVTRVHAAGEADGRAYIVFELVSGGSLAARAKERGRLPWREAVAWAIQIARGLEAIHGAGFVHRDLKPENVLLTESRSAEGEHGVAKVSDLGLARRVTGSSIEGFTKTGDVLGTPAFMAPEQIDHAHTVDARADLYALGATIHALAAGTPPIGGQGAQLLYAVLHAVPARLSKLVPDVPPALDQLVADCLAKDPRARPATARLVRERLEAIAAGEGGARRAPVGLIVGASVVALAVVAGVALVALHSTERENAHASTDTRETPAPAATVVVDPAIALGHVRGALDSGAWAEAAEIASRALAVRPDDAALLACRAEARERLWDRHGALVDATRAVRLDAKNARAFAVRAAARADMRDHAPALDDARKALALDKSCTLARAVKAEAQHWLWWHHARAEVQQDTRENDEAFRDATLAKEEDPREPRGFLAYGMIAWHWGSADGNRQCAEDARVAARLVPRDPWCWILQSRAVPVSRSEEALDLLGRALEVEPENPFALSERAAFLYWSHSAEPALADAERAAAQPDPPARAFEVMALVHGDQGEPRPGGGVDHAQLELAVRAATSAIERHVRSGHGFFARGRAEWRLGDSASAQRDLVAATRVADWWPEPAITLARMLHESGNDDGARAALVHLRDSEHGRADAAGMDEARALYREISGGQELKDGQKRFGDD